MRFHALHGGEAPRVPRGDPLDARSRVADAGAQDGQGVRLGVEHEALQRQNCGVVREEEEQVLECLGEPEALHLIHAVQLAVPRFGAFWSVLGSMT